MFAVITHGLYIFYPLFEGKKRFFKEFFFRKFCLYVWLVFRSSLLSRVGYDGARPVYYCAQYGVEFVVSVLFFFSLSSRQLFKMKLSLFKWRNCCVSLKWWSTQYLFLNERRCYLITFSWWIEGTRATKRRNQKFYI